MDLNNTFTGSEIKSEEMFTNGVDVAGGAFGDGDTSACAVGLIDP